MTTQTSSSSNVFGIKTEDHHKDEIKNFAETAMNELLGWYGYEGLKRLDSAKKSPFSTTTLNLKSFQDESNPNYQTNSRESSKSPFSFNSKNILCGWCKRQASENSTGFLTTQNGPQFCSETCFVQSRRASFKRAKTCNWCRHVKHAISYVDFYDGESQLQFCSDKCLNQYKMQIFCKETQAHLDMNPQLKERGFETKSGLITPDLWLKNCRSRSISPASNLTKSPTPPECFTAVSQQSDHKPSITLAPTSKLLSKSSTPMKVHHLPKYNAKKRKNRIIASQNNTRAIINVEKKIKSNCNFKKNEIDIKKINSFVTPITYENIHNSSINMQSAICNKTSSNFQEPFKSLKNQITQESEAQNSFFKKKYFISNESSSQSYQPFSFQNTQTSNYSVSFGTTPPPITVMVPYPLIIPLPIPIPIPLPITDFIKISERESFNCPKNNPTNYSSKPNQNMKFQNKEHLVEPLDFTKSKIPCSLENLNNQNLVRLNCSKSLNYDIEKHRIKPKIKCSKMKAVKLNTKKLNSKESRPLRKRKRITDCI